MLKTRLISVPSQFGPTSFLSALRLPRIPSNFFAREPSWLVVQEELVVASKHRRCYGQLSCRPSQVCGLFWTPHTSPWWGVNHAGFGGILFGFVTTCCIREELNSSQLWHGNNFRNNCNGWLAPNVWHIWHHWSIELLPPYERQKSCGKLLMTTALYLGYN